MGTTRRTNIIDKVLDEYIVWGGPIVTRRVAREDCIDKGFDDKAIDYIVFGRREVEAPADPAAHLAMHLQVKALGW